MAKKEEVTLGRVIIFGNPNYQYDSDQKEHVPTGTDDKSNLCELLDVQEIQKDRIITSKYVLPLADASVSTSDEGLVYSYNCSLPYLSETAHLADVEKNIIVQQAFIYAGRNNVQNKTPMLHWVLIGGLILLSIIGMFK